MLALKRDNSEAAALFCRLTLLPALVAVCFGVNRVLHAGTKGTN
jgi:hypothetical protein